MQTDYPDNKLPYILELTGVSKQYANGILANDRVSFGIRHGDIHAIVGENGAGKSTLMKLIYGLEQPDTGDILFEGRHLQFRTPRDAIAAGIGLVPQHLKLVPSFSVARNIVLGREPMRGLLLDDDRAIADVHAVSARFGLEVDPLAIVADLSLGEQQKVEILKALYRGARLLLLDEPSAVLTPQEAGALFTALRKLVELGLTVVIITHKLSEVREVSDRYTVLRGGKIVGQGDARTVSEVELTELIVGGALKPLQIQRSHKDALFDPLVSVRNLSVVRDDGRHALQKISFDIAPGEILGIAGIEGNGQSFLAEVLCGLRRPSEGHATIDGQVYTGQGVRIARLHRVANIPEDRLHDGIAADMSIAENVMAVDYHKRPFSRFGSLNRANIRDFASQLIHYYGVVAGSAETIIGALSGGNMQKLVFAREVATKPLFLIACQPTRGVDIGASEMLRKYLIELRDQGASILLISAELDEILALSDRIAVLAQGQIVGQFTGGQVSANELGLYMTGAKRQSGADTGLGVTQGVENVERLA
ncbi:ABC transporter ATP-binding protein [Undibacterium sp. Ji83W]|uniref:ABC transporter ATP-binding protein n=1 Tax=Undibacterium sp. Ji83W TaxID=3413043 RepID=UPI003BF1FFA2